jgi:hypothetical protein
LLLVVENPVDLLFVQASFAPQSVGLDGVHFRGVDARVIGPWAGPACSEGAMDRNAKMAAVWICFWAGAGCGLLLADSRETVGDREALRPQQSPVRTSVVQPESGPDSWCPSGEELDSFLEARRSLPWGRGVHDRLAAPAPVVTSQDGVLIIEDSGVILRNDRVFDLPMETIELVPVGDGFQVAFIPPAYESPTGGLLFTGQAGWRSESLQLTQFAFPFGGEARTALWVTSSNLVAFEAPTEPVKVGLCSLGCYFDEGQVLLDRLPRISPLQHGTFMYGRTVFFQEESDRVIVTWRYDNPDNMDVQVVLFADGRIRLNYAALSGIPWGAVVVVTGNENFWSDLRLGGEVEDPEGDVTIPAPDGPAMDLLGATARQVGTSELLQVELTLAQPPPPEPEERIFYTIEVKDRLSDPEPLGSVMLQWERGRFYWMSEPTALEGSTLRLNLRLYDLPLSNNDVYLTFTTFRGDTPFEQGDSVVLRAVVAPPDGALMLDLTTDLPATTESQPIYEAFTLPAFQPGEVLEVVAPLFDDPTAVEAFAIFQNLWTDIFFFAGAYHAGGNSGADGIGFGSSESPRSPSLLHLNNVHTYSAEDAAMMVLSHELGHRWLYHFAIEEEGSPTRILNPAGSHPAGWVGTRAAQVVYEPLDYSVMGGSHWHDHGDGTFSSPPDGLGGGNGFSWHELYLMGLAEPTEVPDWWYIRDPVPPLPNAYWAPNDTTVSGERVEVALDQLIAVEGPRFPVYPDGLQYFLTPVVLVVRPGEYVPGDIGAVNALCDVWPPRFNTATGFRGSLRCRFHPPVVDITTPASDVVVYSGDTIGFEATGSDDDADAVELRWTFPGVAPDTTGPGPHPVTFPTTGEYDVRLTGVDESGMLTLDPDSVHVTVECPTTAPSGIVQDLRLAKEDGQVRFTWTDLAESPMDYVILSSDGPEGPHLPLGSAASGSPGLLLPEPAGNAYFEVAARNADGCLGPY